LYAESLALWRELGDRSGQAAALNNLGTVALRQDDLARARQLYTESLARRRELGDKIGIAYSLESFARLAAALAAGEPPAPAHLRWAPQLCGAAEALRAALHTPLPPIDEADYAPLRAALAAQIPSGE